MASNPRNLTRNELAEIVGALRPLVDRFSARFGVAPSAVLTAVQQAGVSRPVPSLPANYIPANPIIARMMAAIHAETGLSPAAIAEDSFDPAVEARDALVYAARRSFELSYSAIGAALGGHDHDAVLDAYCRAIARVENVDKQFLGLVRTALSPFKGARK